MGSAKFVALVQYSLRKINVGGPQKVPLLLRSELEAGGRHNVVANEVHTILTRRFEADLAVRLQQLQLQGDGAGSAHLNWLLDACASTLSTHASLAPLLLRLSPPPASSSTHGRRADELPSLLDLCTSLKHMADDVDRQLTLLQRALHTAEQALHMPPQGRRSASPAATLIPQTAAAVRRLRACLPGLQLLNTKQYKPLAEAHAALLLAAKQILLQVATPTSADPLNHALDGTLLISLLLLSSTLSSFAAPTRRSSGATRSACKIIARYCSKIKRRSSTTTTTSTKGAQLDIQPEWLAPLQQLQRDLKQQQMSCVFLELQRLQASASSLISIAAPDDDACISKLVAEQLRQSVDSLRKSSQEAQACISALRSHLASLFQALLSLRLALMIPC